MPCENNSTIEYLHNDDIVDAGRAMNAVRYITFDPARVELRRTLLIRTNILARQKHEAEAV